MPKRLKVDPFSREFLADPYPFHEVETIELCGEPERRLNNTLRGLARLPVKVR